MIASLGMYDRAETAPALDRYWDAIRDGFRARGIAAPDALTHGDGAYWPTWQSPGLVFSQTCGLPYRAQLHHTVDLIGTPDNGLEGCPPGYYRSAFVVRADEVRSDPTAFSGAAFALSEGQSQSGWGSAQAWFGARGLTLRPVLETGSHRQSASSVLEGQVDFAVIDAVTWSLLCEHDEWTSGLRVIGYTDPTPSLPYITAKGGDTEGMFAAIAQAIVDVGISDRTTLRLYGLAALTHDDYMAVPIAQAPKLDLAAG